MGFTEGRWEQGSPSTDLQVFAGADQFTDFAAVSTLPAAPAAGLIYKVVPAATAAKFFITPEPLLLRAGQYATAAYNQQQFGTAAAVPGPSGVANTSDPLALPAGFPPIAAANLTTISGSITGTGTGILRGPLPKGVQINSIDIIYQVLTVAASAATTGLTKTAFANLVAPVVTNIIALGANGLPTAIGAQPQVTNVAVAAPAMIVPSADSQIVLNVNLTSGAGGTVNFYGAVLKCSYNFN
jgi:hypothetical protein